MKDQNDCDLLAQIGRLMLERDTLRKERNEARREWCRLWARTDGRNLAPTQAARLREWDCFEGRGE